ncbi:hypothetical protein LAZ67_8000572 [Cordylochernes scorpioides]|uniref:PiggyBac transposable element-derived protein domain-containing protein n=1 Tax=Cordylochernes scorpioides TaxID=51811 RepID=A0ABY6KR46_9ARAC|nr:hypothetical protein LAZ67_8000572 [Cordylochernes scorpioides]
MAENPNNRLQKFNGSKSAIRPESWIKLYDFENNSLKEDEKIKNLMYYLTDSALEWYADEIISNPAIKRWEVVKEKLIQRFGSYNANPIVSASHRRLKREESIENYFQDKIRLLNQTHLTKEEKINLLTDGLPNDWKDLIVAAQPTDTTKWFHIAASIEQNRASIQFKPKNKIHLATKNNDNRKNVCPFWCPICSKKGIKIKHWVTDCEEYDPNYKKDRPNQNTSVKQVCGAPELLNVSEFPNDWKDLIVAAQPTDTTKWFHIAASIEQNRASIQFKPKNKIHLATKNNDNRKNVCPFWCPICSKKGIKIKHWVTDCEEYDPNYKKDRPNQNTSVKQVCGAPELLNLCKPLQRKLQRKGDQQKDEAKKEFVTNCKTMYRPGEYLTVDEKNIPFKGRCSFKQYLTNKPSRVKVIQTKLVAEIKSGRQTSDELVEAHAQVHDLKLQLAELKAKSTSPTAGQQKETSAAAPLGIQHQIGRDKKCNWGPPQI